MISILFTILLFLVPLIFFKTTSELFEFNKIVTLYIFTILITSAWLVKSIKLKKIIFRRTFLDWPLVIFLVTLLVSSIFSIDVRTSIFGYYSRFNGGLLSMFSYALLYWAYVSNMDKTTTKKSIIYLLISTTIASILATFEHFNFSATCGLMGLGFNNSCWVQDVQNRVFSTFGQPNWLAATIVSLIPITTGLTLIKKGESIKKNKLYLLIFFTLILFVTLLFTKSRSGILGFLISDIIFSGLIIFNYKKEFIKNLITVNIIFVVFTILIGSPWSPSILNLNKTIQNKESNLSTAPALETGGTESGVIRQIVWKGAYEIWKAHPIVGTGPETFAFSYPLFKPIEHNLTSEWDFIYNKAHNEYLNYLATTGALGFISYVTIILFILTILLKNKSIFGLSLLAGFISILITNFFGFSVVATSLIFFLIPAMSITYNLENGKDSKNIKFDKLEFNQKIYISILIIISIIFLFLISRYWIADIYYNKARLFNRQGEPVSAGKNIIKALNFSPKEAIYWSEYATSNTEIAVLFAENNEYEKGLEYANSAIYESEKSIYLSKYNLNLKKTLFGIYYKLSMFNESYLNKAEEINKEAISISPYDPKLFYQLGLLQLKLDKVNDALTSLEKSVLLKPNYKDARFALGSTYKALGKLDKANENFKYILENIDPNDEITKKLYN